MTVVTTSHSNVKTPDIIALGLMLTFSYCLVIIFTHAYNHPGVMMISSEAIDYVDNLLSAILGSLITYMGLAKRDRW